MATIVEFLVSQFILIQSSEDSMKMFNFFFLVLAVARKIASEQDVLGVTQDKMEQYRQLMQTEIDQDFLLPDFP